MVRDVGGCGECGIVCQHKSLLQGRGRPRTVMYDAGTPIRIVSGAPPSWWAYSKDKRGFLAVGALTSIKAGRGPGGHSAAIAEIPMARPAILFRALEAARKPKLRPVAMAIGFLLALLGLGGVIAPAVLSFAPYHGDLNLLRLGIGSALLFTVYGVCLVMVGAAMIAGAFRGGRDG